MPKILIVEDDNILSKAIDNFLNSIGYQTVLALDGNEAMAKLKTENVDLVLLDLILPLKTGEEVLQEMRGSPKTANLPVLVSTAKFSQSSINRCAALGIQGYFIKTHYTLQDIAKEIKIALTKNINFKL